MKKIYLIPGLGADERVFSGYSFPGFEKVVIQWSVPKQRESLAEYAERLFTLYEIENDATIIGVSFGGMIASEIAKENKNIQLILISSVESFREIPPLARMVAKSRVIYCIPDIILKKPTFLLYQLFGVAERSLKYQLAQIVKDTSPKFLRWAITAIGNWKGGLTDRACYKIHGSKDRILPGYKDADLIIEGGGHLIVLSHQNDIERVIKKLCTPGHKK